MIFCEVKFDQISEEPLRLVWGTGNRHIMWDDIKLISWGHHTPTFTGMELVDLPDPALCFSVVSQNTKRGLILDLQGETKKMVTSSFKTVICRFNKHKRKVRLFERNFHQSL